MNNSPEEENADDNSQSMHQPRAVNDVTDRVEEDPNVDQIWNSGHIGGLIRETTPYLRNVFNQFIDGTRFASHPASSISSIGTMSHNRNVIDPHPPIGETRPASGSAGSSFDTMSHHGNGLGQRTCGPSGTRRVLHYAPSNRATRYVLHYAPSNRVTRRVLHYVPSNRGTMSGYRNVLGQVAGGTQPVSHSASPNHGAAMSHNGNGLGQGIGGTRPVYDFHPLNSSFGTMSHNENGLDHGSGGTRPVSHATSSGVDSRHVNMSNSENLRNEFATFFQRNGQDFVRVQFEMPVNISGQDIVEARVVVSPPVVHVIRINNNNNSSFFIPRGVRVHEQEMIIQSRADMVGGYLFTQGPPMVQTAPQMVETRPPMVQTDGHRGVLHGPNGPIDGRNAPTNGPTGRSGGEYAGRIGETSNGDEATTRNGSQRNDEDESTSRDAKRSKR